MRPRRQRRRTSVPTERADSRRKRLRLIDAARAAIAERGLDVAAADIAATTTDTCLLGIGIDDQQ
jgi:AcrR family transcriptional regulator